MSKVPKNSKFRADQIVKMAVLGASKRPKMILLKIWVAEKSWNFHLLQSQFFSGLYSVFYIVHNFLIFSLFFRVLVRAVSYTIHGLIPASCVFADRYNREEVVASLGREINLNPPLTLGQLPDTSEELLKLDQVRKIHSI